MTDTNSVDIPSSRIDPTKPHPARRYDYWLGGKDNFAADRESGDAVAAAWPTIRLSVIENRHFLQRAVWFLVDAGIRQFLDIGTGLPTANNTHQVAQSVAPDSRIVYVDNDPLVLVHARALLTSAPEGVTAYLDADVRTPERILDDPELHATLDMDRPIGLLLLAIMHFISNADDPHDVVARLVAALPRGSYLVVSQGTYDPLDAATIEALETANAASGSTAHWHARSRAEFTRFFDGLELVEPGIVPISDWRPEPGAPRPIAADVCMYGGVGRK
jgi:hypothetical protein